MSGGVRDGQFMKNLQYRVSSQSPFWWPAFPSVSDDTGDDRIFGRFLSQHTWIQGVEMMQSVSTSASLSNDVSGPAGRRLRASALHCHCWISFDIQLNTHTD